MRKRLFFSMMSFVGVAMPIHLEADMALIPAGSYRPLYIEPKAKNPTEAKPQSRIKRRDAVTVAEFLLDKTPVTRAEFVKFVSKNPQWAKSKIKRLFAETSYLKDWKGDFDLGSEQSTESPVRFVSWFVARTYCRAQGKRLPTLNEWEYAASQFSHLKDINQTVLDWYSKPNPEKYPSVGSGFANDFGVYDLHGLVWEWVEDFNSSFVSGESREDSNPDQTSFCGAGGLNANDFENYAAFMRFGFRSSLRGNFALSNLGFRCAKDGIGENR